MKLSSIILLDGTIGLRCPDRDHLDEVLTQIVWTKPDVWRSREDALKWLSTVPGYRSWDPRVRQFFVVGLVAMSKMATHLELKGF